MFCDALIISEKKADRRLHTADLKAIFRMSNCLGNRIAQIKSRWKLKTVVQGTNHSGDFNLWAKLYFRADVRIINKAVEG